MGAFGKGVRRVCAVVAGETCEKARRKVREALKKTSTVEIRLDWIRADQERRKFLNWLRKGRRDGSLGGAHLIATCRRVEGGGRFRGSAGAEVGWLREAARAGCEWCDVEIETARRMGGGAVGNAALGCKTLLSEHHFRGTPRTFAATRMRGGFAPVKFAAVKVAAHSQTIADSLRILQQIRQAPRPLIAIAMGEIGLPARVLALREGSALAYAPVSEATAPGQIPLREFIEIYRAHELTRKTRVYGVIGDPIGHSLSPLLHNTGFVTRGMDQVFLPFLVKRLPDFLRAIPELGIHGFSVTLPHKRAILRHLAECDALAEEIGAVNTVVVDKNGKLRGFNTDYWGVRRALETRMKLRGSRVLILGAGGAARAAAFAVARAGGEVVVCARRERAAKELAGRVKGEAARRQRLRSMRFDAMINATPIGMHPREEAAPLDESELNCDVVMDMIYRPLKTGLLKMAGRLGIETVSGVEMFLAQAFAQWGLWNQTKAPEAAMRTAVLRALRGGTGFL